MGFSHVQGARAAVFRDAHNEPCSIRCSLSPRVHKAERLIDLALGEARRLNSKYCGGEHLFLGIMLEGEGVAADILDSMLDRRPLFDVRDSVIASLAKS